MALEQWALPQLKDLLPLEESELKQIITYTNTLSDSEAKAHLENMLGDSKHALQFIDGFNERRGELNAGSSTGAAIDDGQQYAPPPGPPPSKSKQAYASNDTKHTNGDGLVNGSSDSKRASDLKSGQLGSGSTSTVPQQSSSSNNDQGSAPPPSVPPPSYGPRVTGVHRHTNPVIEAGQIRARDEQDMQQFLQRLQFQYGIYNSEIEPEHDTDYYCNCPIHIYQRRKWGRYKVQDMWSRAVMYPGEKAYNDDTRVVGVFSASNPYRFRVVSPYGYFQNRWGPSRPVPGYHAQMIHQTIQLNNNLNRDAQLAIDAKEPKVNIWDDNSLDTIMSNMSIGDKKIPLEKATGDKKAPIEKAPNEKRLSQVPANTTAEVPAKKSKLTSFRKSIGIKSSEERAVSKAEKMIDKGSTLRDVIVSEENGRWPDDQWRYIVAVYQDKVGMTEMIADLRAHKPIQYLHMLRAGFFEPIPVAWANQPSNPLKFSIESSAGWRGITPAWRGYEDTAEERLYWVLNHRKGSVGMRMKPDFISEMNMAQARMATAVEPPPAYFDPNDTCHIQHTSEGYSKQVMPPPFRAYDRPEVATDDTMILLDVSGSMDFNPLRPNYTQYLITGYSRSTQPKNKDVAKAITRRFTDAMANHDHQSTGYDLVTFSDRANYVGTINHKNLDQMWHGVRLGGGTRVMTGWQMVKELHFQKHAQSATHHPVYGWQAGPETPMLRLLLMLDGEATDMDEFELDLLGLSWAHVTIFLIGVDGCPHHHRHANELQRISDVNHHIAFVDAQGNTPERFVTHELLKRHLGYDISMQEFSQMEELPAYSEY